jgi:hypothetical protein
LLQKSKKWNKRENPFGLLTLEMRNEEIREEGLISDTCTHYDVNGNLDTLGLLIPQAYEPDIT